MVRELSPSPPLPPRQPPGAPLLPSPSLAGQGGLDPRPICHASPFSDPELTDLRTRGSQAPRSSGPPSSTRGTWPSTAAPRASPSTARPRVRPRMTSPARSGARTAARRSWTRGATWRWCSPHWSSFEATARGACLNPSTFIPFAPIPRPPLSLKVSCGWSWVWVLFGAPPKSLTPPFLHPVGM